MSYPRISFVDVSFPSLREALEMVIDCETCIMRDIACSDCVVSVLLGPVAELVPPERTAIAVLANGGLVPPLRMAPPGTASA